MISAEIAGKKVETRHLLSEKTRLGCQVQEYLYLSDSDLGGGTASVTRVISKTVIPFLDVTARKRFPLERHKIEPGQELTVRGVNLTGLQRESL